MTREEVTTRFVELMAPSREPSTDAALVPRRVAAAAAELVGAHGASLTLALAELRIPLGASDRVAARAESVQFTEGTGPCIHALETGERLDVPAADLRRRWPRVAARWHADTDYRSVVSVPLPIRGAKAAVNLYSRHEHGGASMDPDAVDQVVELIATHMQSDFSAEADAHIFTNRANVWVAIGLVVGHASIAPDDALQRMRRYAVEHNRSLDDLARDLVVRVLPVDELDAR